MLHQEWVNANRGDGRYIGVDARSSRFLAERRHFARSILAFKRGKVDHRDRGFETPELGAFLDAPRRELGDALFDADLIYCTDLVEQLAEARALDCGSRHGDPNLLRWKSDCPVRSCNIALRIAQYNDENGDYTSRPRPLLWHNGRCSPLRRAIRSRRNARRFDSAVAGVDATHFSGTQPPAQ